MPASGGQERLQSFKHVFGEFELRCMVKNGNIVNWGTTVGYRSQLPVSYRSL